MQIQPFKCCECGKVIGYEFLPDNFESLQTLVYCYLCAHSMTETIEELDIWKGKPTKHDLYAIPVGHQQTLDLRSKFRKAIARLKGD